MTSSSPSNCYPLPLTLEICTEIENRPSPLGDQATSSVPVQFSLSRVLVEVHHSLSDSRVLQVTLVNRRKLNRKQKRYINPPSLAVPPPPPLTHIGQQLENTFADLQAGQTLVGHRRQPVRQHVQDVVFQEGELQVLLYQLRHDHLEHRNLLGGRLVLLVQLPVVVRRHLHILDQFIDQIVVVVDYVNVPAFAAARLLLPLPGQHQFKVGGELTAFVATTSSSSSLSVTVHSLVI